MWNLKEGLHNINGFHICYRGGIIGTYDKIEKRPFGFVTETHSDDVSCIISEDPDGYGGEPPVILAGKKEDLKKALLVEFLKHQKASKNNKEPVPCLAVHTKKKGILVNPEGYKDTEIGEVEGVALLMLA